MIEQGKGTVDLMSGFDDGTAARAVLHERALALAARDVHADESPSMQVLQFVAGDENYAIETSFVSEVFPVSHLAVIPGVPDFVVGVVSVRGRIVSVLDLRPLFGQSPAQSADPDAVIILRGENMEFAIAAERVGEVTTVPLDEMQSSLATLAGDRNNYVRGVTADRLVVLDALRMLSDPRLVVRHDAGPEAINMEGPA